MARLYSSRTSSIRSGFFCRASQKACYRFLNNKKVTEAALIEDMTSRAGKLAEGRDLLVLQDTSSFNLNSHYYRLKKESGLGPIEDNFSLGFFLHASLVVDAFSEAVLGYSDVQLWHRVYDDPDRAKKIVKLPIEEKESFKWIKAALHSKEKLSAARSITFVEDREGDIYEQFARITDEKTHYVIRSAKERRLAGGGRLRERLSSQPCSGTYAIHLLGDKRKKRAAREAIVEVRYCKVRLQRTKHNLNPALPEWIDAYAVEARETGYEGKDSICWRLLTSHTVNSFNDASGIIECYRKRWYIEQVFRLLKKQGVAIEGSQLESGWAIRKLCAMSLTSAVRVIQLMLSTEEEGARPVGEVFSHKEQQCLAQLNNQLQGKTDKQRNPYKPETLIWAKWIIARLGGWKGYKSQRNPGPITILRGLASFNSIYSGWCLAFEYFNKDVGTQ